MGIAQFLDRQCAAEVHPLDTNDDSTSFATGAVDQIAYQLPGDEDYSYITGNSDDDEIDALAAHLVATHPGATRFSTEQLAEFIKQVRDEMQAAATEGETA